MIPPAETLPIETAPTQTGVLQLSARSTFEMIAAMQAYMLILEEWVAKDISLAEQQAVLSPLIEFGILPLGYIFDQYAPDPQLTADWNTASEIYRRFLPSKLDSTTSGELTAMVEEIGLSSTAMIQNAALTASSLGVDTSIYGPGYAGAIEAAHALLPELAVEPQAELPIPGDLNPEMLPIQIIPFTFDFAGSEIFFTIGMIENSSSIPQQNVTIEVTYFNFLDENLGTVRGRLLADVANPGGNYPFIATDVISGEEVALKDQTRFEVAIFSSPTEDKSYQAFELTVSSSQEINGEILLRGQFTNTGDQALDLERIRIGAAAYDQGDILIGVGEGRLTSEGDLAPGGTAAFEVIIQVLNGTPASYQLFAEAVNFP
jgi:hypothetical protein